MDWLRSKRRSQDDEANTEGPETGAPAPLVRAAPGVSTLFDGLKPDGSHTLLDLGPASEQHFRLYSEFARRIRFADLVPSVRYGAGWEAADRALPPEPRHAYDLVLAWNFLDRLMPEERPWLVERLAAITAAGARLYTVVEATRDPLTRPLRFTLLDIGRVSQEVAGPAEPAGREILPAEVERLLRPFEVVHAYTLRQGLREYVAVKP